MELTRYSINATSVRHQLWPSVLCSLHSFLQMTQPLLRTLIKYTKNYWIDQGPDVCMHAHCVRHYLAPTPNAQVSKTEEETLNVNFTVRTNIHHGQIPFPTTSEDLHRHLKMPEIKLIILSLKKNRAFGLRLWLSGRGTEFDPRHHIKINK